MLERVLVFSGISDDHALLDDLPCLQIAPHAEIRLHPVPEGRVDHARAVELARDFKPDFIMVRTTDRNTAWRLASNSSTPVLIIPYAPSGSRRPPPARRILAPVDSPERAARVLRALRALGEKVRSEIILFHSSRPVVSVMPSMSCTGVNPILVGDDGPDPKLLDLVEDLRSDSTPVRLIVSRGDIVRGILAYADAVRADMILMATAARRSLARFLLGSISRRVVFAATTAVLLCRP